MKHNGTAYSVLLVEDEKPTLDYLACMIEANPQLTLFAKASNCSEAIEALNQGKPDILVTDIGLPDGCGIDVIRKAQKQYPHLEAMVITVFGDEENVVKALEAGATGYLLKEQAFDELGDSILALMRGETAISPKVARFLLKRFNSAPKAKEINSSKNLLLTKRENEVLALISKGYSYNEIAESLELSTNTVRAHIRNIYRKLAVRSRSEAVFEATNLGLISLTDID
ncbi:MAG: response regulator transcription factor [Mariprofundaceae bacterium]